MTITSGTRTYSIAFTQRNTMATTFSPAAKGNTYFLKAKSGNGRSVQLVGYATVVAPDQIEVSTVSGKSVGVAKSRDDAKKMIDAYHRKNNGHEYMFSTYTYR